MTYVSSKSISRNIVDSLLKEEGHISVERLKVRCVNAQPNPVSWQWAVNEYIQSKVVMGYLVFDKELNAFVLKESKKKNNVEVQE
jgi:hypothetical protein